MDKPIFIDQSIFERYHSKNAAFNRYGREHGVKWVDIAFENRRRLNQAGMLCKDVPADSELDIRIKNSLDLVGDYFSDCTGGGGFGKENTGIYLKWNPVNICKNLYENPAPINKDLFTNQVKSVAQYAGADLVGITSLNRNWVLAGTQQNPHSNEKPILKDIVFKDVRFPEETDKELIIPDSVNNAVVFAIKMNTELILKSPSPAASAADGFGYGQQGIVSFMVAEFIRSLGYVAIPCKNDTALSIPLAIEAGLGEGGRNGLLITPEFGACVRIGKVLTNMPLNQDKPIKFGVEEFCNKCRKCANICPAKSIPTGSKTLQGYDECNNNGVQKWYNKHKQCLQFWIDNGATCSNCISVCAYTKK